MFDASFVVFLCFVAFMILVLKYGYKRSITALDSQIGDIKSIIENAQENLLLAEKRLEHERLSQRELSREIDALFAKTDKQIDIVKQESAIELQKLAESKEHITDTMIDQIRLRTVTELKETITQEIQAVLADMMTHRLDAQTHEALNDDAIRMLSETVQSGDNGTSPKIIKSTKKVANS